MFRYFLAFLLINTCYQSLGNPIQPSAPQQLSKSLVALAGQCKNDVLSHNLLNHVKECDLPIPPYGKKQFQCLIFYDINMQLCSAVTTSKLMVSEDSFAKVEDKQDVNALCALAKDWVFTNMSDFVKYKDSAEKYLKLAATCGEVCGVEDTMNEANYFCKYYKVGLEMLKNQVTSTMANNANNVAAPVISEPDLNVKEDIPVTFNSNPVKPEDTNTKTMDDQLKQTAGSAVGKTPPQKAADAIDDAVVKAQTVMQATSKQTPSFDEGDNADIPDNTGEADVNVNRQEDPVVPAPENIIPHNDQVNKTSVVQAEKPVIANDDGVPELPSNNDQKPMAVLENPKPKGADAEDYGDSDGNDADDENEDPGLDIKDQETNQQTVVRDKLVVPVPAAHEAEVSQKEFFPNSISDGFSDEDNDHFFPFFMTSVVLMVLLYVLYHNKSKVSKVFFGLVLEGRQSGRRRNSRGHSYRRLDTLEQAMSANTAAPPSKIIY